VAIAKPKKGKAADLIHTLNPAALLFLAAAADLWLAARNN
jgi:hypothetical protein